MESSTFLEELRKRGYRDTQTRRLIIEELARMREPASPYDIRAAIARRHGSISPVTVYRVTELLQGLGMVHKHPCSGKLSLCALPAEEGLHGYLHCQDCGRTEEFCSRELSDMAKRQAASRGYRRAVPLLEILGSCTACSQA